MKHSKQSLDILLKSLPSQHPRMTRNYENIGCVHKVKDNLKQALICFKKVADIYHNSLPSQYAHVIKINVSIENISI